MLGKQMLYRPTGPPPLPPPPTASRPDGRPWPRRTPAGDEYRKPQLALALIRRATPRGRAGRDIQPGGGEGRGKHPQPYATSPFHLPPLKRSAPRNRSNCYLYRVSTLDPHLTSC